MGAIWAALWWQLLIQSNEPVRFLALAAFSTALIAALFIDLEHFIIPDSINAIILFIGLAFNAWLLTKGEGWFVVGQIKMPASIAGWIVGVIALWLIAFGGRVFLGRDAMGHGDIKLARGMGAVLFPSAALMSFGLSIVVGLIFGIISLVASRKSDTNESEDAEDYEEEPESIGALLKAGLGYLLLIDVFALFIPKLEEKWFGVAYSAEETEGEDDWKPGLTHIPFGPALAVSAIAVALFEPTFRGWVQAYWDFAMRR